MKKLFILTIFGAAMGWWEGVVVVYIREILSLRTMDLTKIIMEQIKRPLFVTGELGYSLIFIERTREVATIAILICIALLAEKKWFRKIAVFLWAFAVWDLVYYLALKILIGWPQDLNTIDCLFLIPKPWIAPVWVPVAVMVGFLVTAGVIFSKVHKN